MVSGLALTGAGYIFGHLYNHPSVCENKAVDLDYIETERVA